MTKRAVLRTTVIAIVLATMTFAQGNRGQQNRPQRDPRRPNEGRSIVATQFGIVAASQPLAARAGVEILERGGNAVDAAIAANAAMGLMEPAMNGIGGDLFVIYYEARQGRLTDSMPAAGRRRDSRPRTEVERLDADAQSGIHSVTVPGAVAGWDALRSGFGTKPFSEILAPAIYYAENGFPVTEIIGTNWGDTVDNSRNTRPREDVPRRCLAPKVGEVFRNPDLAKSFRLVAEQGRDGFYKGPRHKRSCNSRKMQAAHLPSGPHGISAGMGDANQHDVPRLDSQRTTPEQRWHCRTDDAEHHGAVSAKRLGIPQPEGSPRNDRSEEAGVRRPDRYVGDPKFSHSGASPCWPKPT